MQFFKWLWENISVIKEFFWIIFTLIATIIAILTYKRARFTLLQPMRSEVIKRQVDEMLQLLTIIEDKEFNNNVDYINILLGNLEIKMNELSYKDDKSETKLKYYKEMFIGTYMTKEMFDNNRYYPVNPFFDSNNLKQVKEKSDFELLQEGIVKIHGIKYTKKHFEYIERLQKYVNDPIIPTEIKQKIIKIIDAIHINVTVNIPQVLKTVILSFYNEEQDYINPMGVENVFNELMIKHDSQISELKQEIREYLKIDLKW